MDGGGKCERAVPGREGEDEPVDCEERSGRPEPVPWRCGVNVVVSSGEGEGE